MSARRDITLSALALLVLSLAPALCATPIRPTPRELLKEAQRPQTPFVAARVGWETSEPPTTNFNLALEEYGPQATVRAVRASLKSALVPDPSAMAGLLVAAFGLRWLRVRRERRLEGSIAPVDVPLPRAA